MLSVVLILFIFSVVLKIFVTSSSSWAVCKLTLSVLVLRVPMQERMKNHGSAQCHVKSCLDQDPC